MKIRFFLDSGANIHSCKNEFFEPKDLGLTEEEWIKMSYDEKYAMVEDWSNNYLQLGFEEVER
jgi:hypothetical protein